MDDISVEIHLGAVTAGRSRMAFSLKLNNAGAGSVWIYASDSDGIRSGTLFILNESEYNELKAMVAKTEKTIQELRQSGKMREMKALFA